MKKLLFTGAAVAIVTPFNPDGSLNLSKYEELIDWQIRSGTDAIVAVGTTGENAVLSGEEHRELMRCAVSAAAHRVPVICSTGSNDTAYCIETSKAAEQAGADGLLLVTPYYNKTTQRGLIKHYEAILSSVSLPAILYHIPGRTGLAVKLDTFTELSKHQQVAGLKEASGNVSLAAQIIETCGDDMPLYSGNDDLIVPLMSIGAKGVISVLSNILPRETHEICVKCLEGDFTSARELALRYLRLANALFSEVNPIPVKAAMNLMGMSVGGCRLPLCNIESANESALRHEMSAVGLVK